MGLAPWANLKKVVEVAIDQVDSQHCLELIRIIGHQVEYLDETIEWHWPIFTDSRDARARGRYREQLELLASVIEGGAECSLIHHTREPSIILPAMQVLSRELIKYVAKHPKELHRILPHQFEEMVAEILSSFGWELELNPYTNPDRGYSIFAIAKDISGSSIRTSYVVECKKYPQDQRIGARVARQLFQVKTELKASHAILATTSDFSKQVYDFQTARYDFDAKNFHAIVAWCKQYTQRL